LDWIFYSRKRKTQLLETLTWLADGVPPAFVETDRDVLLLHGRLKSDARQQYACLFNLHPDTIERVRILLPETKVTRLERLDLSGAWRPVGLDVRGRTIHCAVDAPTMEPLLLRFG
jgi:hypothetical protein